MQSDMKKILMMFFALMTGVTAASAQLSSGAIIRLKPILRLSPSK